MSFHYDPDLDDIFFFAKTLWLMMMLYHTTFGYKKVQKISLIQIFSNVLSPHCDLDHSKDLSTRHSGL